MSAPVPTPVPLVLYERETFWGFRHPDGWLEGNLTEQQARDLGTLTDCPAGVVQREVFTYLGPWEPAPAAPPQAGDHHEPGHDFGGGRPGGSLHP